jgi:hypothetical protein
MVSIPLTVIEKENGNLKYALFSCRDDVHFLPVKQGVPLYFPVIS